MTPDHPSADWLYRHLRPFLRRLTTDAATEALIESYELGHLTLDQMIGVVDCWTDDVATGTFRSGTRPLRPESGKRDTDDFDCAAEVPRDYYLEED